MGARRGPRRTRRAIVPRSAQPARRYACAPSVARGSARRRCSHACRCGPDRRAWVGKRQSVRRRRGQAVPAWRPRVCRGGARVRRAGRAASPSHRAAQTRRSSVGRDTRLRPRHARVPASGRPALQSPRSGPSRETGGRAASLATSRARNCANRSCRGRSGAARSGARDRPGRSGPGRAGTAIRA